MIGPQESRALSRRSAWAPAGPLRMTVPGFGPVPLIEARVVIASLVLAPVLWARREVAAVRVNAGAMLVVGVINSALPFTLLAFAIVTLPAGFTSILNSTAPIFATVV